MHLTEKLKLSIMSDEEHKDLLERIQVLEDVVVGLLKPKLMYKRPGSDEYSSLNEALDYLHNRIEELESKE